MLTTHLQLVPRSRIRGSIHLLPLTSSWLNQLSTETTLLYVEQGRICRFLKMLSRNLPGWNEEDNKNFSNYSRHQDRKSNPGSPEYEAVVQTTHARRSVGTNGLTHSLYNTVVSTEAVIRCRT
jgi:hypothetical protein